MFLYLVQHGEAKSKEEDPARPLSCAGIESVEKTAACLSRLNLDIDKVVHSGKLRAEQTATIISIGLPSGPPVSPAQGLLPDDDPDVWSARLIGCNEDLMIVGHLPHLSSLASLLLCGDSRTGIINFKNAGVVCLKREEKGEWLLQWTLIPEILL